MANIAGVGQKPVSKPHQDISNPTNAMSELAIDAGTTNKPTLKSVTDQMHEDIVRQVSTPSM